MKYLGHRINASGVYPDEEKVRAIKEMPTPESMKDIQRFLGLVNYVCRFVENLSEMNTPMKEILKTNAVFVWGSIQQNAFDKVKDLIVSDKCLSFYDVKKDVVIEVDACKTGLGAVLLQDRKPVAYASRSMTPAQMNYAMIEKELQAVVFACERFHQYIHGKKVTVYLDHKPLEKIIMQVLGNTPPRLQRMLLHSQKYDVEIIYKPGKDMIIPDTLSHAYLADTAEEIPEEELNTQIHMVYTKCLALKSMETVKETTETDDVLTDVKESTLRGWSEKMNVPEEASRY